MKSLLLWCFTIFVFLITACGERVSSGESTSSTPFRSVWEQMVVTGNVVNLRLGPGTQFEVVDQTVIGDTLFITGCTESADWYRVYIPHKSLFAWISSEFTDKIEK